MADEVLKQGVQGISDLIAEAGLINLDFADVRTVMTDRGIAHMGVGRGRGENRVQDAVKDAIESPLLETSINGQRRSPEYYGRLRSRHVGSQRSGGSN